MLTPRQKHIISFLEIAPEMRNKPKFIIKNFLVNELGDLEDPKDYEDVSYILFDFLTRNTTWDCSGDDIHSDVVNVLIRFELVHGIKNSISKVLETVATHSKFSSSHSVLKDNIIELIELFGNEKDQLKLKMLKKTWKETKNSTGTTGIAESAKSYADLLEAQKAALRPHIYTGTTMTLPTLPLPLVPTMINSTNTYSVVPGEDPTNVKCDSNGP